MFSVLMSVYFKEDPACLEIALDSIFKQTLIPSELVLVIDGPIGSSLTAVIDKYLNAYKDKVVLVTLGENVGLGKALNIGIGKCSYDLVARMDSDDCCFPDRFEKQIDFLNKNAEISVVGCSIKEFNIMPGDLGSYRKLPSSHTEIITFAKLRNPLNHPTVIFNKAHVLAVGSYEDMPLFEDYYLWIKMLCEGYRLANIDEALLYFRVGNDMIGRRHGLPYATKELRFLKAINKIGFINTGEFIKAMVCKLPLRLLPKKLLKFIYNSLLR